MIPYIFHSSDLWPLHHKVVFDGVQKLIYVNDGESIIDVKTNLYSDWKEWIALRDYAKFLPAFRTTGGDPIDVAKGLYAGDMYFLINGWRVVIPHVVTITGVLYTEEGVTPYIINKGAGVSAVVSNLVQTVIKEVPSAAPTAVEVASAVRTGLTPELAHIMSLNNPSFPTANDTAAAVWSKVLDGLSAEQIMKVALAALAGKRTGLGTPTEQYMAHDGVTPVITFAPTDTSGNGVPSITP